MSTTVNQTTPAKVDGLRRRIGFWLRNDAAADADRTATQSVDKYDLNINDVLSSQKVLPRHGDDQVRPRNVLSRTALTLASLGLMGCSATWSIGVKHDTSTGGTTVEGKIEGEIEMESHRSSVYGPGFDAHNFAIDTSGTTIPIPNSGW